MLVKKRLAASLVAVAVLIVGILVSLALYKERQISEFEEKIRIAKNIYSTTRADETIEESAELMWEVINSHAAPPEVRANAINWLALKYLPLSEEAVTEILYARDPRWRRLYEESQKELGDMVEDEQDVLDLASRKAFEWSYSIYPTSYASHRIARWYTRQLRDDLLRDDPRLSDAQREDYINIVKEKISVAEKLFAQERANGLSNYWTQRIYFSEGVNSGLGVYLETQDPFYKNKTIRAYTNAVKVAKGTGVGTNAKYHLASFLWLTSGDESRIKELLDQIIVKGSKSKNKSGVYGLFAREIYHPAYHAHRGHIVGIAKFHEPFKQFLIDDIGWPVEVFE